MKKLIALVLSAAMMSTFLLSGCVSAPAAPAESAAPSAESAAPSAAPSAEPEEMVDLNFYMNNGPVLEFDRVMAKANEIIGKEINAKLNLVLIDGSSYADKMNLMINSGDEWDLCFAASWGGINFFENAAKGAYADLTDLIPQFAPQTYSRIPEGLWDGVKVNGKIYGLVNYQQWGVAQRKGFAVRRDLADEVGFDWKAMKGKPTLEVMGMLGDFMGKAKKTHPDMIGYETTSIWSGFANEPLDWDMESVGDAATPGWIRFTDVEKVMNQFETEEFASYCDVMRDWFVKGYVRKDGATVKDPGPDRKAGKMMCEHVQGWPDSIDFPENSNTQFMSMTKGTDNEQKCYTVSTTRTVIPAAAGATAAVAINAGSKNIEKSLQLMELLNTNDDLFKLISMGEEGVDYEYAEDGKFKMIEGKYNFNWNEWQIGQSYSPTFNRAGYDRNEAGKKQQESQSIVFAADREAEVSPMSGFVFDQTPVKTEMANCSAVITEMVPALSSGSVDPKPALKNFLERLKSAGVDAVIAEKQAQYDAWRATK